jgi:hypothetical protein
MSKTTFRCYREAKPSISPARLEIGSVPERVEREHIRRTLDIISKLPLSITKLPLSVAITCRSIWNNYS